MRRRVTHSLVKALRAVPGISSLDDRTLLALVGESANLFWPAESVVFERGSPADGLYFVLSGAVRILEEGGRELSVLGPGNFFGEFSLLLGTPHQHVVRAAEDTELMVVPKKCFDELIAGNPDLGRNIREQLEERVRANEELAARAS
jgi:CRP-like cAMP-binding protein